MEWNGSILAVWNGSMPVFGLDKNEERNGSILCSVLELHDRMEQPNHNFFSKSKSNRAKVKKKDSSTWWSGKPATLQALVVAAGPSPLVVAAGPPPLVVVVGPPPLLLAATLPGPATAGCGRPAWPRRP
jgi:hypothetical protein